MAYTLSDRMIKKEIYLSIQRRVVHACLVYTFPVNSRPPFGVKMEVKEVVKCMCLRKKREMRFEMKAGEG